MRVKLKGGLRFADAGPVSGVIEDFACPDRVAVIGADYPGLRPVIAVQAGDRVAAGDTLFTQRGASDIRFPAPAAGKVAQINRGARRSLTSIVIDVDKAANRSPQIAAAISRNPDASLLRQVLLQSGLWCAFRTRPFDRVPAAGASPRTLFVTAIDTHPYAPDPVAIIGLRKSAFEHGLRCLARLGTAQVVVCTGVAGPDVPDSDGITRVAFEGPHPAGCVGIHVRMLDPQISLAADTWHIGYQDVIAIGHLLLTGEVDPHRVISVAGPGAVEPRLVRTVAGAPLAGMLDALGWPARDFELISGSALGGRPVVGASAYLGRYHHQITLRSRSAVLPQNWRSTLRALINDVRYGPTAFTGEAFSDGGFTGMLPIDAFDAVWPLNDSPAALLRALLIGDADAAQQLGCLAYSAEDIAPLSYVCPARQNYALALADTLEALERRN